jgi:hypothetical protein
MLILWSLPETTSRGQSKLPNSALWSCQEKTEGSWGSLPIHSLNPQGGPSKTALLPFFPGSGLYFDVIGFTPVVEVIMP